MKRWNRRIVLAVVMLLPMRVRATDNPTPDLSANLRGLLLQFLPNPLYEDLKHWGGQKEVVNGLTWRGKGLLLHPEAQHKSKNHGSWWKVRITTPGNAESLVVQLRDHQQPEPGRQLFTAFISLNTDVEYERQEWDEGTRLYSGSIRARMRLMLTLQCEATARLEPQVKGLPEMVFRMRVVKSDFRAEDLVVEHVPSLGGSAAKLLGEAARSCVKQLHPSLERKLLDKANTAILKGGDTKEIRVSLSKLLGKDRP